MAQLLSTGALAGSLKRTLELLLKTSVNERVRFLPEADSRMMIITTQPPCTSISLHGVAAAAIMCSKMKQRGVKMSTIPTALRGTILRSMPSPRRRNGTKPNFHEKHGGMQDAALIRVHRAVCASEQEAALVRRTVAGLDSGDE